MEQDPARWSARRKDYRLRERYGITEDDYQVQLAKQDGRCAICGREAGQLRRQHFRLSVDHDHDTGTVRGLLCHGCNRALGLLGDNPALLQRALAYLTGS